MKAEGILLDLDNTVYGYEAAHGPALEATLFYLAEQLYRDLPEVHSAYVKARHQVNTQLHGLASSHSRLLYFQGICEQFGCWPCEIAVEAEDIYWSTFFQNMHVRAGCIEFLKAVKPTPIAIVTDLTARIQFQKMTKLGVHAHVDAIVTSEEVGKEKPHQHIFELAAKKLGLPPARLCMVGDSWERDMSGALKLSMQCYWFRDKMQEESKVPADAAEALANGRVKLFSSFTELIRLVNAYA